MTICADDDWLAPIARLGLTDPHVVIAMSGGVDSSVAALRVRAAGLRCSALFMKNWNEPSTDGSCAWEADVSDCLRVCDKLDIALNTVDLSQAYWDQVFADFLAEYRRGRTPNPDVLCNREIKFKAFLERARARGGDLIATGHYARNRWRDDAWQLLRGADPNKDQSYFLYTLGQEQLATALFPVGGSSKRAVRAAARGAGLATHDKQDSTGICFIGERRFREFLGRYVPAAPGPIETLDGTVIGTHHGAVYYTLGQRQGLGIGGVRGAAELPWFVARKDLARNALIVVQGTTHPALYARRLFAHDVVWVRGQAPALSTRLQARTRHRQAVQACVVDAHGAAGVAVEFERAQRAVTPGQSVVFYAGQVCLGGGIIDATAVA